MKEKTKKRIKGLYNFFKFSTSMAASIGAEQLMVQALGPVADKMMLNAGSGPKATVTKIILVAGVCGMSLAAGIGVAKAMDEGYTACETVISETANAKTVNKKFKEITDLTDEAIQAGVNLDRLREICDKIGEAKNMKYTDGLIEYLDVIIFELKAEICGVEAENAENEETTD